MNKIEQQIVTASVLGTNAFKKGIARGFGQQITILAGGILCE